MLGAVIAAAGHGQTLFDPDLTADLVAEGLADELGNLTTAFFLVDADTLLAANRNDGRVHRVDLQPGVVVQPGPVVLDLHVISAGGAAQSEYGVQGMEPHPGFAGNGYVYIRYDRSPAAGRDTPQDDVVLGPNFNASLPTANVIERYVWDPDGNGGDGELLFDALIHSVTVDTRYHHGGPVALPPDGTLYTIYGDLRRIGSLGWLSQTAGPLLSVNIAGGVVEDNATIVRLRDDGSTPPDNPFDPGDPMVPQGAAGWFAYGLRNSFGLTLDPATCVLWETENGEFTFDEINRVTPGLNGGWKQVMGPVNHPQQKGTLDDLVELPGSAYSDPEFSWLDTIGVTGLHFLFGSGLGAAYDDVLLVGCVNKGHLWRFRLNGKRDGFVFETPALQDLVDDRSNALEDPVGSDGEEIVLGVGFGTPRGIIAIERGPEGLPYLLNAQGGLHRLRRKADLDADGSVGIVDFLLLIASWGPCDEPCPPACLGDLDGDCVVGIGDFLALLGMWG